VPKRYYIADNASIVSENFRTKKEATKALAQMVREDARECRRRFDRCSVVGSAREGSVKIRIGGRQGFHLYNRYVINKR
jgi:hypothetical protein